MEENLNPLFKLLEALNKTGGVTIFESPVSVNGTASIMLDKSAYEKLHRQMKKVQNTTVIKPEDNGSDK